LTILFIVGCTTLFTPVDINLEQVVDFLNFYACNELSTHLKFTTTCMVYKATKVVLLSKLFSLCNDGE
jgi:hypothetical protein